MNCLYGSIWYYISEIPYEPNANKPMHQFPNIPITQNTNLLFSIFNQTNTITVEKHLKEAIQILDFNAHPELNGVRVYLLNVTCLPKEVLAYLASTLSLKEKKKAVRFRREIDRQVYVAGRGMLRVLIGECLNLFPSEIDILEERFGKPYLKDHRDSFQFNLSNSGHYIAIAIHPGDQQVGVDLEVMNKKFEYWEVAAHYFTSNECDGVFCHKDFYKIWTKKEALLKATGVGLVDGLNKLDFSKEVNFIEASDDRLKLFKNRKYTLYTLLNEEVVITLGIREQLAKKANTDMDVVEETPFKAADVCHVFLV